MPLLIGEARYNTTKLETTPYSYGNTSKNGLLLGRWILINYPLGSGLYATKYESTQETTSDPIDLMATTSYAIL